MASRFSHKNAYIEFATLDLSGRTNNCTITFDIDISEVTCFGEGWDEYVENIATWSVSVAGFTDQDAAQIEDVLFAVIGTGEQDIVYAPQGAATGYKFTGKAIMKTFSVGGGLKTGCPYTATFQGNGTPSRTACP